MGCARELWARWAKPAEGIGTALRLDLHKNPPHRTLAGAEVALVIKQADGRLHTIEIKHTLSPKVIPGLVESMEPLGAHRGFLVIPEGKACHFQKFRFSAHSFQEFGKGQDQIQDQKKSARTSFLDFILYCPIINLFPC